MSNWESFGQEISLWECFHDGLLESLTSDKLKRIVRIVIDVPYLREFHGLSEELRFHLLLQSVSLVEARQFTSWPGDFVVPKNLPYEEAEKLRSENYSKGRFESVDWQALEAKLLKTDDYEISNADIDKTKSNTGILKLNLFGEDYPEIEITAKEISFFLGQDQEIPLEQLINLGRAYWQDFADRRNRLIEDRAQTKKDP